MYDINYACTPSKVTDHHSRLFFLIRVFDVDKENISPQLLSDQTLMVERLFLVVLWGGLRFVIVVFPYHSHLLFLVYLGSPAGKGLTSWLSIVMFNCLFVTFPCSILGQVWYLIVSIPALCPLSHFYIVSMLLLTLY